MEDENQLITELKSKIKELKQKNNNLESSLLINNTLIDNIPKLFILLDTDGKILSLNAAMAKSLGNKKEDLIGKNVLDYFPSKVADFRTKMADKVIDTKKPIFFEDKRNNRWFKTGLFPILDSKGNVIQISTIVEEITEEKTKLQESEEKFRMLSDQSLMGLGIIQGEQIKYANDAIVQVTEYSKDEMFSEGAKLLSKIVHPDDLSFVQKQLQKKLSGDKDVISRYSCRIISKTGELKWVEIFSKTIHYEGKNADLVTFVDITERKKTEEKLRTIIDNANDGIAIMDDNWQIKYVNPKTLEILGYTKKELGDINVKDIIDPSEIKKALNRKKSRSSGIKVPSCFEIKIIDKKGNIHYLENNVVTIEWDGLPAHLTFIRDTTELITARKEIVQRKEYLQNVIDSASEVIFTIDSDLKIRTWNRTSEQITGYKKRQVVGKAIKQIELFDYPSEIEEYMKAIQNKKTATLNEISVNTIYGIKRIFSVSPSYIKDESKNIIEILFVCRDITKEKETFGKIQSGNSFLILESDNYAIIEIFNSLLESKKIGLYIGRITNKELQTSFKKNIPSIIKLTEEKDDQYPTSTNIEEVHQKIKDFIKNKKNTVILIDRMDYLITNYPFESVMKILYKINDLIQKHNSILLLRVNPSIMNKNQIAILNEDFKKLPSQKTSNVQISQELYEILTHIQNENKTNIMVNYGNIRNTFSISKVTAKKRLESLIYEGLIYSRKQGKTKIINITEKGKNLLKHRTII